METIAWTIAVIVGVVVAWFAIKVGVGMFMPPQKTGRSYLKQELKKSGIDVTKIPNACIDEFVKISLNTAYVDRSLGKDYFNNNFVGSLNLMVCVIKAWFSGSEGEKEIYFSGEDNLYREILERHDVR